MVDPSEQEQAAMRHAMQMVGEVMEEIGWATRLSDLNERQALVIVEVALSGFQDAMREIAAASTRQSQGAPF